MVMEIPGWLLTETVTVEPYQGVTAGGVQFGAASVVRAHVQERRAHNGKPRERSTRFRVWTRLGLAAPIGSKVTVRGTDTTVWDLAVNDGRGLPVPSHLEMACEQVTYMASSVVTILRGTAGVDEYGDPTDSNTAVAADLPALILQTEQDTYRPVDQRGGVVETFTVRLPADTDVEEGDRIRDDRTLLVYIAERIDAPLPTTGPAWGGDDVIVTCRRAAATSTT